MQGLPPTAQAQRAVGTSQQPSRATLKNIQRDRHPILEGYGVGRRAREKSQAWVNGERDRIARERVEHVRRLEERDEKQAALAFDRMDIEGRGAMTRDQARDLLRAVIGHGINEDGLDMVFIPAAAAAYDATAESAADGFSITDQRHDQRHQAVPRVSQEVWRDRGGLRAARRLRK